MVGEETDSETVTRVESGAGKMIGSSILLKIYLSFSAWRSMEEEDSSAGATSKEGLDLWTEVGESWADPGRGDSAGAETCGV